MSHSTNAQKWTEKQKGKKGRHTLSVVWPATSADVDWNNFERGAALQRTRRLSVAPPPSVALTAPAPATEANAPKWIFPFFFFYKFELARNILPCPARFGEKIKRKFLTRVVTGGNRCKHSGSAPEYRPNEHTRNGSDRIFFFLIEFNSKFVANFTQSGHGWNIQLFYWISSRCPASIWRRVRNGRSCGSFERIFFKIGAASDRNGVCLEQIVLRLRATKLQATDVNILWRRLDAFLTVTQRSIWWTRNIDGGTKHWDHSAKHSLNWKSIKLPTPGIKRWVTMTFLKCLHLTWNTPVRASRFHW